MIGESQINQRNARKAFARDFANEEGRNYLKVSPKKIRDFLNNDTIQITIPVITPEMMNNNWNNGYKSLKKKC